MRTLTILFFAFVFITALQAAEKGLELIHAERTVGKKENGEQIRYFEGQVHFRQDTLDMFCDRAVFYTEQERADFAGNVHIVDGHRDLWANKIEYYPQTKQADCFGDVRIQEKDNLLHAGTVSFNFDTEQARARQKVFIYNEPKRVKVWGQEAFYSAADKYSEVMQSARLAQLDSSGTDSMLVTAGKLQYFREPQTKAVATDSVVIYRGGLKAVCDSAIVFPDDQQAWLKVKPIAWYDKNELSGNAIQIGYDSSGVRTIDVYEEGSARNLADSAAGKWNKLVGKQIHMDVRDDKPRFLKASGNATSTYYMEKSSSDPGMNFATSDTIQVFFKDEQADSIRIVGGAEGIYYPEAYKGVKQGE